ncbi:uncharacterized protein K452DRAFT_120729 [Aplosporella prunicola CBS 121167]|uniref:Uncharacterized protein n=1 Tax=Aplosporella prunicola CBS 121167 TaxID=1176127 RepID=A0A6A6BN30_9PEZI|nr:uncharacterized protein K452DRAFT_120729 [Aplosporella prunicola CBS 121167]KAF2145486.1 hypothetical protein K452DRAFT_120729 [Aplosporella prunicola CBS 121167]
MTCLFLVSLVEPFHPRAMARSEAANDLITQRWLRRTHPSSGTAPQQERTRTIAIPPTKRPSFGFSVRAPPSDPFAGRGPFRLRLGGAARRPSRKEGSWTVKKERGKRSARRARLLV